MPRPIDLSGRRFGRLTVTTQAGRRKIGSQVKRFWRCRCDCGAEIERSAGALTTGNTTSCGCALRDAITKHGGYHSAVYKLWHAMLERCRNPRHESFKDYGGRGISVCARWSDFASFRADMGPRPIGSTLERANTNGHYEPVNCRWAAPVDQANNRRNNRRITFNGETLTAAEWARRAGLSKRALLYRLDAGWPLAHALTYPADRRVQHR